MSTFEVQHVPKQLAVFTTILDDHVEFNKYLKQVILEHRQNNPESTKSNVKAWHSSWHTHKENPKFQPLIDLTLSAVDFISQGYFNGDACLGYKVESLWCMMYEAVSYTHLTLPTIYSV